MNTLLNIKDLTIKFADFDGDITVVDKVSLL
jgi:ABC-type antimicrobial peptide transport system ATPase subunit